MQETSGSLHRFPKQNERELIAERLKAAIIAIDVDYETCLGRAMLDDSRKDKGVTEANHHPVLSQTARGSPP